jgi:hypothetical protein
MKCVERLIKKAPLMRAASTACAASRPQLPGVAAPLVDINGTGQTGAFRARSRATVARIPVEVVDLPQSDVPEVRSALASVVVHSVSISTRLMGDDALAISLVPRVLGAPCGNIHVVRRGSARAGRTVIARTVTSTIGRSGIQTVSHDGTSKGRACQDGSEQGNKHNVHFSKTFTIQKKKKEIFLYINLSWKQQTTTTCSEDAAAAASSLRIRNNDDDGDDDGDDDDDDCSIGVRV